MRKTIEVVSFAAPVGQEYTPAAYPGVGFYHNPTTLNWYLVYAVPGGTTACAMWMGTGVRFPLPTVEDVEPKLEQVAGGITAADLLKAIAISQNPLLAKELLK